jgi:Ca2+/Na+ antiporter
MNILLTVIVSILHINTYLKISWIAGFFFFCLCVLYAFFIYIKHHSKRVSSYKSRANLSDIIEASMIGKKNTSIHPKDAIPKRLKIINDTTPIIQWYTDAPTLQYVFYRHAVNKKQPWRIAYDVKELIPVRKHTAKITGLRKGVTYIFEIRHGHTEYQSYKDKPLIFKTSKK